jgi:hypothetical protein
MSVGLSEQTGFLATLTEKRLILINTQSITTPLPHRRDGVALHGIADEAWNQSLHCLDCLYFLGENFNSL